jgi:hypothetical protein
LNKYVEHLKWTKNYTPFLSSLIERGEEKRDEGERRREMKGSDTWREPTAEAKQSMVNDSKSCFVCGRSKMVPTMCVGPVFNVDVRLSIIQY